MHNQDATSPRALDDGLVGGRYRLLSVLGEGGMGRVWRARDEVLHREVAVKEVRASAALTPERRVHMYARLEREAWAAARISSRGVVTVHDVVTFDNRPWIVMELIRGTSLAEVIGTEGALPPAEVARIGAEVLAALSAAHEAGVLHRDVKPANVLIADDGRVVLTDFGIATLEGDTALTMTGEVVGSPEYLAPERALGQTPGTASDLWSLGALLFSAVQGRSPFRRTTALATLRAVVDDELPPPHRAGPLTPVIEGLMRKDPQARMTAKHAAQELHLAAAKAAFMPGTDAIGNITAAATEATAPSFHTDATTAAVTVAEELPTAVTTGQQRTSAGVGGDTMVAVAPAGTTRVSATSEERTSDAALTASAPTTAPLGMFGPPPAGADDAPTPTPSEPGVEHDSQSAPAASQHNRRSPYIMGATAAVVILLGGGLTYALVGGDNTKDEASGSTSQPVSVTVAGGTTTYDGSCPAGESQAPWFTATFETTRAPVQFSYRWISKNGSVVDRQWRTMSFREGEAGTKKETVRLSAYAREGTLASAMAVEIKSPFDTKSNSVNFSITCRPNAE
ncbi:protein kinase [Streptomyces sp. NPDC016675]|uniref:serine/threonine-protein kinase n=1 Tax=Streptomyces sp. NPDC016675 TaxID=3364970 RepID=UPI0036FC4B8A